MLSRRSSSASNGPLSIDVERGDDTVTVVVAGELDVHTAPQLRSCLLELVAQGGAPTVVIELGHVAFCDSTGLGVFVGAHRRLEGDGRQLRVEGARPAVRHLFEVSGLDQVLHLA